MKLKIQIVFSILLLIFLGCSNSKNQNSNINNDSDFKDTIIKVGDSYWTTKNLNIDCFQNGDKIRECNNMAEWKKAGLEQVPAYCYLNFDKNNDKKYGKLYNWYAITDSRHIAPEGWRVPTYKEWDNLQTHFFPDAVAKLRSSSGWNPEKNVDGDIINERNGNNESHFNALPGGYLEDGDRFYNEGESAQFWTCTIVDHEPGYTTAVEYTSTNQSILDYYQLGEIVTRNPSRNDGFYVRLIKVSDNNSQFFVNDDIKETRIDSLVWSRFNLDVDVFQNGDTILEAKNEKEWYFALNNKQPAWCYYNNDPYYGKFFGKIYNYYAVVDQRKIAPLGWHIATSNEWKLLKSVVDKGESLKSKNGWLKFMDYIPTDSANLSILPGGFRGNLNPLNIINPFEQLEHETEIWCLNPEINYSEYNLPGVGFVNFNNMSYQVNDYIQFIINGEFNPNNSSFVSYGRYIRCVKD